MNLDLIAGADADRESLGIDRGLVIRRQVMGDAFVENALSKAAEGPAWPLQKHITEHVWGSVWSREGLDRRSRSIATLGILVALRAHEELPGHVRGALTNGLTREEIVELIIHTSAYCGAPAALSAMRVIEPVLGSSAS